MAGMTLQDKPAILSDAVKYHASCASSGGEKREPRSDPAQTNNTRSITAPFQLVLLIKGESIRHGLGFVLLTPGMRRLCA